MTALHIAETITGRIIATPRILQLSWSDVLNAAGDIRATISEDVVRDLGLRQKTHGIRTSLVVEEDGRLKQAGPVWSRTWDWQRGTLTLGASGLWSWLERRLVRNYGFTELVGSGLSLGGLARLLVEKTLEVPFSSVPIVLPPAEAGSRTETWHYWQFSRVGEQLRQLTQRATDAPDIAFRPRRRADDERFIEWVMQVGTETRPGLYQTGQDWVFDTSAPKSPVLGISTDEDATGMAQWVFATGNGQEEDILSAFNADNTLLELPDPWPLTEGTEAHPTVEQQGTLYGHAASFLARSSRPIEGFKVTVRSEAAREVLPGDYCRVITRGDTWLGDMDKTMRVKSISGDLTDAKVLEMFPLQAAL